MILEIRKKIDDDEMKTIKIFGGNFTFLFNEELKRLFIKINENDTFNLPCNDTFNLPCKNLTYSVHGNIVFAETE